MKLLILGDLHGRKPKIPFKDFDMIICVGDVCDNSEMGKLYSLWFKKLNKNKDLEFEDVLKQKGINKQKQKAIEKRSFQGGRKVLEHLNSLNKPIFFVPGNWDQSFGKAIKDRKDLSHYQKKTQQYQMLSAKHTNPKLIKGLKNIIDCQFKLHEFQGLNLIGYGLTNGVEKAGKNYKKNMTKKQFKNLNKKYKRLTESLFKVYAKRNKKLPTLFLSHSVPYGTKLDIGRQKGSYAYKKHLGSTVARDFIKKYKPLLNVGGHIHDFYGKTKLGKTVCINAGAGKNATVLVKIDKEKTKRIIFNKNYKDAKEIK
ncbi:MAG: metallophosphoesterase [archaeon]